MASPWPRLNTFRPSYRNILQGESVGNEFLAALDTSIVPLINEFGVWDGIAVDGYVYVAEKEGDDLF